MYLKNRKKNKKTTQNNAKKTKQIKKHVYNKVAMSLTWLQLEASEKRKRSPASVLFCRSCVQDLLLGVGSFVINITSVFTGFILLGTLQTLCLSLIHIVSLVVFS